MRKILLVMIFAVTLLWGCNKQVVDFTYAYEYAIVKLPNGKVVEGKLQSWNDYEGEQLQLVIDGQTYLVNSMNVVMMTHAPEAKDE